MNYQNSTIDDYFNFKNYNIHYTIQNPCIQSKIGILLLHGRSSHSAYWNFIFGKQDTYKLFALDYPGQGKSSGRRGHFNTFKILPDLCSTFISTIVSNYHIESLFIVGESLGSLAAFYTVLEYKLPIKFQGIIFMPGIYQLEELKSKKKRILLFIGNILMPFFRFRNKRPFTFYTENEKTLEFLKNDTYYCRYYSFRYVHGIYKFVTYLNRSISKLTIPILIYHGRFDYYSETPVVNEFYNKIPETIQKKMIILEQSKHWLCVSDEAPKIYSTLTEWIKEILGK